MYFPFNVSDYTLQFGIFASAIVTILNDNFFPLDLVAVILNYLAKSTNYETYSYVISSSLLKLATATYFT
jgi:hypothetical protein